MKAKSAQGPADELRGASRLAIDAVLGVTDLVEAMHRNIASGSGIAGVAPDGPTTGVTGLVYRSIRGVTKVVGKSLDLALGTLAPMLDLPLAWPGRGPVIAALNGVLGDHLAASGNPLAVSMRLERRELDAEPSGKILVLVHGLCMSGPQWLRNDHDHGTALARDLGYTPVYLDYNSGEHISVNGREFAQQLETLVGNWPVPVAELVILGHSMGGLVTRSAAHYAAGAGLAWPGQLSKMIFLGTPHHGAPLERAGSVIDMLLGASPYSAPLARIGMVRSAGIQDLRHGNLVDEHWGRKRPSANQQIHLPSAVDCYAIAAVQGDSAARIKNRVFGDGLVLVGSALGRHARASHSLCIPEEQTRVMTGMNHFDLLSHAEVYECLRSWLE